MELDAEIDKLVTKINALPKEPLLSEDVPEALRIGPPDHNGQYRWNIKKTGFNIWISPLEKKLPRKFPPSYFSLISRYTFPAFEFGPIFLFGNTGEKIRWELHHRIFQDEFMSRILFANGFLKIGQPEEPAYDPICFDMQREKEGPLVQIDHEGILLKSEIRITENIADSFVTFLEDTIEEMRK